MGSPSNRRYAQTHEWHQVDGEHVIVGITQFAVDELTDITYVEVTETDKPVKVGEPIGEIESVKATSELYIGVDGTVVEVNQQALDDPSIINQDPFEKGWIAKILPDDPSQLDKLMTAEQYDQSTAE